MSKPELPPRRSPQTLRILIHIKHCICAAQYSRHYPSATTYSGRKMTDISDPEPAFSSARPACYALMRRVRGMSRNVLAKGSGISSAISRSARRQGKRPIVHAARVSNAMGAHLEDLIPSAETAPNWAVIRGSLAQGAPAQIAQARDVLAGAAIRRTDAALLGH